MELSNDPIEFEVGTETYSLKMGFWAICSLENIYDKSIYTILTDVFGKQTKMDDVLTVFHSCMLAGGVSGKPIEDVSKQEAADIIDRLGIDRVIELVSQAIEECPLTQRQKPKPKGVRGAGPAKPKAKKKAA